MTSFSILPFFLAIFLLISLVSGAPNLREVSQKRGDQLKTGDVIMFETDLATIKSLRLDPDETGCMYLVGTRLSDGKNIDLVIEPEDIIAVYQ